MPETGSQSKSIAAVSRGNGNEGIEHLKLLYLSGILGKPPNLLCLFQSSVVDSNLDFNYFRLEYE